MIIAVDEEIPFWKEAFAPFGEVRPFTGRSLKQHDVRDAEVLIVRSITPVDASLLDGTSVRFVGGASAGFDNIDRKYLRDRGIRFHYAAGCNADSVSEYIITALHIIASRRNWTLKDKSIAVIGVGNVGSRVAKKAGALGMRVHLCDPPLRDLTGDSRYKSLDDVLQADILTFHVPLTSGGAYPTWHMLDREFLERLTPEQVIINSSRGPVFDNRELKAALETRKVSGAVLDVWEGEPVIDYSLLELVDIGTPHIAGTALDGKIRATDMIRDELGRFCGIRPPGFAESKYPPSTHIGPSQGTTGQDAVASVLLQLCDLSGEDAALRALQSMSAEGAAAGFDKLRTNHPLRLEFRHFVVDLAEIQRDLAGAFAALGFEIGNGRG